MRRFHPSNKYRCHNGMSSMAGIITLLCLSLFLGGCRPDWETLRHQVVLLEAGHSQGSAFPINQDGYYVTNYHVIKEALNGAEINAIEATVPTEKIHPGKLIAHSKSLDLAVVRIPDWKHPPFILSDNSAVKIQQHVKSIGYPGVLRTNRTHPSYVEPSLTDGRISALETLAPSPAGTPVKVFTHEATINPGNSGGPLVDECGHVVGVNEAKANADVAENTFLAIRVNELKSFLKENRVDFSSSDSSCLAPMGELRFWQMALSIGLVALLLVGIIIYLQLRKSFDQRNPGFNAISQTISKVLRTQHHRNRENEDRTIYQRGEDGEVIKVKGGSTPASKATLQLVPEQKKWPTIPLTPGANLLIGRDAGMTDLAIPSEQVSRQHLVVCTDQTGIVRILDLGSSNGTYIDHKKVTSGSDCITQGHILKPENRLILGDESVVYRLHKG